MEETDNNVKTDISPFLDQELTTMYADGVFSGYDINDPKIREELFGTLRSKYTHLNVFNNIIDGTNILAIVFFDNAEIDLLGYKFWVSPGSVFTTTKDIDDFSSLHGVNNIHFRFGYGERSALHFGNGSTEYEVTALIRDTYTVKVFANSEEEAIEIANSVPIHDWEHPVIPEDSHLQDRRVIRHCRWGNLSARKI